MNIEVNSSRCEKSEKSAEFFRIDEGAILLGTVVAIEEHISKVSV
jgi:hypothetical protein